jgi:hypothetical protein
MGWCRAGCRRARRWCQPARRHNRHASSQGVQDIDGGSAQAWRHSGAGRGARQYADAFQPAHGLDRRGGHRGGAGLRRQPPVRAHSFTGRLLRIGGRTLNLRHVIMAYRISFAVVPRNRNLAPRSCDNRTKVSCRGGTAPANSVAGLEFSGLIASHFPPLKEPQALARCGFRVRKLIGMKFTQPRCE